MLQRQQSQLNAGVQELYCRIQDGRGWPGEPLEFKCHGQAPVHAILERLGLLEEKDVWDEIEDSEPEQQLPEGCQSSSDEIQRLPETPLSIPPAVSLSKECIDSPIAPLTNDLFPPIDVLQDTITTPQPFRNFLSVVGSTPLMFGGYAVPPHSFGPIAPVPPPAAGWMNGENDWVDIY